MIKTIKHFTTITNTVGATFTPDVTFGPEEISGFHKMDVVCVVGTMTGAGMNFYFQELFGDDYVTTALIANVTSTIGATNLASMASYDPMNTGIVYASSSGSNPLLGKGTLKRIVTTASGSLTAVNADIYCVFYSTN